MISLGLTGSIASGKSTALKAFADMGIPTFSADGAVHRLYRGRAAPVVEGLFPGVTADGIVDREALSARLLDAPNRLSDLEAAIHPLVRDEAAAYIAGATGAGLPLVVLDIPLLFESGIDWGLDAVAVTVCDEPELRRRALARPGMSVEKLDAILARQLPQDDKKHRADFVIDTNGPLEETAAQVRAIALTLMERNDRLMAERS